jgi:hypothetical protein
MKMVDATRRAAYQLYMANGYQDGFAEPDFEQAAGLVRSNWGNGQRVVATKARDGRTVFIEISPGHSSY